MASSGNFPLWSPLIKGATNLSLGNTRFDGTTNSRSAALPFIVPTGTKFYVECLVKQMSNYNIVFGLVSPSQDIATYLESQSTVNGMIFHGYTGSEWRTQALVNGSRQGFSGDVGMTATRVLGMTINTVDNEIKMYLDNTLIGNGTISISATQEYRIFCSFTGGAQSGVHMNINCGHDSSGAGEFTSGGGNADENGFGDFQNSPPSGFLALCSANLPISDDIDPAQTDDNCPSKLMTTANWAGTAGSKTITGVGFKPDLTIIKSADQAGQDWCLFDTNRGAEKLLEPNQTTNEENNSNSLTAFSTDGFTVGSENRVNGNSFLMTAQCWKANAGTTVTNSDGDIDSTLQANPTAGFSIAEWPSYSGDKKIGHGLSKTPEFIISKLISGGSQWSVFHKDCDSGKSFKLNSTDGQSTQTIYATTFDATTFGLGASFAGSGAGISYIWHSVEGYSKFSSYVGNGNADGPFIFTGHMPRCVWIKRIDSSAEWAVYFWNETTTNASYVRLKQNPLDSRLTFDSGSMNNGELIDFLSNGFKIRDSDAILNASSGNYVYMSWGSVPFKYNNTF